MRILMYLPKFYPSVGGLEIMAQLLADGFHTNGHEVQVVTLTPDPDKSPFPYPVHRMPTLFQYLSLIKWADVLFQRNVSLKGLWPLLLMRRHYIVSHGGWYRHAGVPTDWRQWVKHQVTRYSINVCPSHAIAHNLAGPATVIPNAYRSSLFYQRPAISRDRDLVFVGRLVSEKGADVLIEAIQLLAAGGTNLTLTIVGDGPEKDRLRQMVSDFGLEHVIHFEGILYGESLANMLCRHRIMVVPSICEEGFGTVALEGIACGCVVVGTNGGGLPAAIGPCGLIAPRGDRQALATSIERLLIDEQLFNQCVKAAPVHLKEHTPEVVLERYISFLNEMSIS